MAKQIPVEEGISVEEVLELRKQLRTHKDDPEKALQLLKILNKKCITAELLIETLIGKALTGVNDKPGPGRHGSDTPDVY